VDQILDGDYYLGRNRRGRTATHIVIGLDYAGRCLAVPVIATDIPGTWRPITAWPCKDSEWARLS
jgi:hypothetical protein